MYSVLHGRDYIIETLNNSPKTCYEVFQMKPHTFQSLFHTLWLMEFLNETWRDLMEEAVSIMVYRGCPNPPEYGWPICGLRRVQSKILETESSRSGLEIKSPARWFGVSLNQPPKMNSYTRVFNMLPFQISKKTLSFSSPSTSVFDHCTS